MSFPAIQAVLDHSKTKGPDRAIMLVLAFHQNPNTGQISPSLETIANEAGLTRRCVYERIKYLVALGELCRERRKGGNSKRNLSNIYKILLPNGEHSSLFIENHTPHHRVRRSLSIGNKVHKPREQGSNELKGKKNEELNTNQKTEGEASARIRTL